MSACQYCATRQMTGLVCALVLWELRKLLKCDLLSLPTIGIDKLKKV